MSIERDAALIEATLKRVFADQEDNAPLKGVSFIGIREDETIFAVHNINVFDVMTLALALKECSDKILKEAKRHAN